ncbi:deubiquitinase OTUD6B-like isoform X2 [Ornithodoros turicata]|uniref:deubiquitinase OTUD6B-like isoform X2 n=1 Tax=Ornithodoros turicata TaxID=34597 RepID=UPI003139D579
MADSGDAQNLCQEDLLQAHRKERKDLQARIQNLKHSIPKGDKKRKREVAAEVARLEAELDEKHQKELGDLSARVGTSAVIENGTDEVDNIATTLEDTGLCENGLDNSQKSNKVTRAGKRREKKKQKEQTRQQQITEQEYENQFLPRATETRKMKEVLAAQGLAITEIPSDGNCMYKAVEHQLSLQEIEKPMAALRQEVADYMRQHVDEFLPFLTSKKTGDMMDAEEFEEYCEELATTPVWGGQVELRALSHVCKAPVIVVQATGPSIEIGMEYTSKPILLSYHRHMYDMGEHYNSLIPATEEKVDEFSECA